MQQRPSDFFAPDEIGHLRTVEDWRGWWSIFHCWGVIFATWAVVAVWTNPLTIVLGIVVIGARQLGLAVLSHDGAHFTLFNNRALNDWASEWLLSRPLTGGSIYAYRKYHLKHHAFTQQDEDPDLHLSAPFPISKTSFKRKVIRDLTGQTGWKQYGATFKAAFRGETGLEALTNGLKRLGPNILINLVFLLGFALAGVWYLYFLLWWAPAFTWNRFITRIRNVGEHAAVPDNDDRLRNTRTIEASWWERAFIAPYGVNYHLEHHLIVNCPYYKLNEAHEMLLGKGLREKMELQPDYASMLRVAVPA
jgi:fatty acid desaturase